MIARRQLGDYRTIDVLGRGGMGVVYRAVHEPTGADAAVKTVRLATETTLESIRREIQTLGALDHPGVVAIRDHGVADGLPWYAMALLRGRTLQDDFRAWFPTPSVTPAELATRDLLRPSRQTDAGSMVHTSTPADVPAYSLAHVISLFRRICEPLAYVHGRGVLHRDLSPTNVFLVGADSPVLFDFGLASQFRSDVARDMLEVGGEMRGTPHYMAPEQARGEIVDARADIYALGCMLYEAITGRPPFLAESALAVLMQHVEAPPVSPAVHVPDMPRELETLVMHMLAKRPRDRIGYAEDVAVRLEQLGAPAVASPTTRRTYTYRPELAGRTAIIDSLAGSLLRLTAGTGGAVLLAGESGVGKTRLAGELATRAFDHGLRVITGECEPIGGTKAEGLHAAPLHPLRPLLRTVADRCRDGGAAETARLLGPMGGLLVAYEPSLSGLGPTVFDRLEPTSARFRVIAVLRDVIRALTDGDPLVLVIDDLQWADELTLALLASLGAEPANLFVIATVRAEEMTPSIETAMHSLRAVRHDVKRLGRDAIGAMIRDMLALDEDAPALTDLIATRSEGNPMFAAEYVRAAVEEGAIHREADGRWRIAAIAEDALPMPGSVRSIVHRRLHSLTPAARQLASAASVLGRSCHAPILASTAAYSAEGARTATMELLQHHVLEEAAGDVLRFQHDSLREQAYAELSADDRRLLHHRAATALELRYRDGSTHELHLAELANHWEQAGELARAVDYLERAAEHALTNAAFGEAKTLLVHALELPAAVDAARRGRWERQLGEAYFALGDLAGTVKHLTSALDRFGHALPQSKLGWSSVVAGGLSRQVWSRTVPRGVRRPQPALVDAALATARMTSYYFFNDDSLGFMGSALRAINLAERAGSEVPVAEIYAQLGYIASLAKADGVARSYFDRAYATAEATRDPIGHARSLHAEAAFHVGRGNWTQARALASQGLRIVEDLRNPQDAEVSHTILGHCDFATGHYAASLRSALTLYKSAQARSNTQHATWGIYTQARAALYQGRLDDAITDFTRAMAMLEDQSDQASRILCGGMLAAALARAGRVDEARDAAAATTMRIGTRTPPVFTISEGFICAADAYLMLLGHDPSLLAATKVAIGNVTRLAKMFPIAAPAALALTGRFLLARGKRRAALRSLSSSLALAESLQMPYDAAVAHLGLADASEGDAAHAHAVAAEATFRALGCAWHLARRA